MITVRRLSRRDCRRLGIGLIAYGTIGLLLLLLTMVLVAGSLGAIFDLGTTIDRSRGALVGSLNATSAALTDLDRATGDIGANVVSGATAARDAAQLTTQLADAMDGLQEASGLSVLGNRPFAALGDRFAEVGARSRTLSTSLAALADTMDRDVADLASVRASLVAAQSEVANLRGLLAGSSMDGQLEAFAASRVILLSLLLWLAAPALLSLVGGSVLLRSSR